MAMKTDKFEDILRRKLESISPQYQEKDWQKMQHYMQSKKPVSSRIKLASTFKYAATACLVAGLLFLYFTQIEQNKELKEDLAALQGQIELINLSQSKLQVQPDANVSHLQTNLPLTTTFSAIPAVQWVTQYTTNRFQQVLTESEMTSPTRQFAFSGVTPPDISVPNLPLSNLEPIILDFLTPLSHRNESASTQHWHADLKNRLSNKEIRKNWNVITKNSQKNAIAYQSSQAIPEKNTWANLNQKVSYRIGIGYQADQLGSGKSIHGQLIIGKRISIASGLTWLKVKPLEFISEKIFRDKTSRDFQQTHFTEIPKSTTIANINIRPSLVQIPLTVAFRESMANDWAYTVGAGTSLNIQTKEKITFDSLIPAGKLTLVRSDFERKVETPLVNSIEISTGVEKAWHPLVLNAEARLYHYFKPLNPVSPRTGPGINLKLSYQLGRTL
jgi:hypothetical protein